MQPGPGQSFQRVRRRSRWGQNQAVGPDRWHRQRPTALRGLHQPEHPALDGQVEAPLSPAAEQGEPLADDRARDGSRPRIAGHAEGDPAGAQVLDHLVAEASLFQVTLERLVAPAPDPLGAAVTALVWPPRDGQG